MISLGNLWRRAAQAEPEVAVCIPAWMAAPFIERTIGSATGQTHRNLQILVSVDAGSDETLSICERHAARDRRIKVFGQPERLGWVGNVNFLLDQVRSPYFMLYFHDDILLPGYVSTLVRRLEKSPEAGSIHCDMGHFGGSDHVSVGRSYEGSAAKRLMTFLLAPNRGSPLRSLTRARFLDGLRLPTGAQDGYWANGPYLMRLIGAAPALHAPETLYLRWDKRKGGLTDGWRSFTAAEDIAGLRANIAASVDAICEIVPSAAKRRVLIHALQLETLPRLHAMEKRHGTLLVDSPAALHPEFVDLEPSPDLSSFGPQVEEWASKRLQVALEVLRARAGA